MRTKVIVVVAGVLALAVSVLASSGRTVFVSPTGSDGGSGTLTDPFATLPHAVFVAGENGTVNVMPGVYTKVPSIDVDGITLAAYPDNTARTHVISDLHNYPSPIMSISGTRVVLRGLGFAQSRGYASIYGALHVARPGEVSIELCEFWDNSVGLSVMGGHVSISESAFNTRLSDGKAGTAVLFQYADFGNGGVISMDNTVVSGGTDLKSAIGTGVGVSGGSATFTASNSLFTSLAVVSTMGYIKQDVRLTFTTVNVTSSTRAFYAYGMQDPGHGYITIKDSAIVGGGGSDADGPGVSVGNAVTVAISDSTLNSLTTSGNGGAIYCGDHASVTVINSLLANNVADNGSPAWCSSSCAFVADGTTSRDNTAKSQTGKCPGV